MKSLRNVVICSMFALLSSLFVASADDGAVELTLEAGSKAYMLGDPVSITVWIRNTSPTETVRTAALNAGGDPRRLATVKFQTRRKGEANFTNIRHPVPEFMAYEGIVPRAESVQLNGGEKRCLVCEVQFDWEFGGGPKRLVFPVAGIYEIRALYAEDGQETNVLASRSIEVEITEPVTRHDRLAWAELHENLKTLWPIYAPEAYRYFGRDNQQMRTKISNFVQNHKGSRYSRMGELFQAYAGYLDAANADARETYWAQIETLSQDKTFALAPKAREVRLLHRPSSSTEK